MKDTENVKNYCMAELVPNSILHGAYHIIDGLWFIATQTLSCSLQSALTNKR